MLAPPRARLYSSAVAMGMGSDVRSDLPLWHTTCRAI